MFFECFQQVPVQNLFHLFRDEKKKFILYSELSKTKNAKVQQQFPVVIVVILISYYGQD